MHVFYMQSVQRQNIMTIMVTKSRNVHIIQYQKLIQEKSASELIYIFPS